MFCVYVCFREIDSMIKQSSHQTEIMKSLEFEINKFNLRKKELENDVISIMKDFEIAKNDLNELVCYFIFS